MPASEPFLVSCCRRHLTAALSGRGHSTEININMCTFMFHAFKNCFIKQSVLNLILRRDDGVVFTGQSSEGQVQFDLLLVRKFCSEAAELGEVKGQTLHFHSLTVKKPAS